jgi:ubiquinone/menaquinone biosynthesis C-methylase UbiE
MTKRRNKVKNPFVEAQAAKNYHRYRPQYHDVPFKKLKKIAGKKFERALDVACGTGHSTVALAKISRHVIGCDNSKAMLKEARRHSKLEFIEANAERLPFEDESFDLLNISMAIHWVDHAVFLSGAKRVLRKGGFLTLDNCFFSTSKQNSDRFNEATKILYDTYLPTASRNIPQPNDVIEAAGFKLKTQFSYQLMLPMTFAEFTGYLMTQSNFLALSRLRREKVKKEISRTYRPFFAGKKQKIKFLGAIKVFKRK